MHYLEMAILRIIRRGFRVLNYILNKFGILLSKPEMIHGSPAFSGATLWSRRLHQTKYYFDLIKNIEGDILESGVHWGYGILIELALTKTRKIYGFDSFAGHSKAHGKDFEGGKYKPLDKSFKISQCDVWKTMEIGTGKNQTELEQQVELIPGWIQNTLPVFLARAKKEKIKLAFIHSDMDLYEPFKCTLENSWELLSENGIIVLGQLNDPELLGKTTALNEFLSTLNKKDYELKSRTVLTNGLKKVEQSWLKKLSDIKI